MRTNGVNCFYLAPVFLVAALLATAAPVFAQVGFIPAGNTLLAIRINKTASGNGLPEKMITEKTVSSSYSNDPVYSTTPPSADINPLIGYALALKTYARQNGYDTTYAFLGNMGILCNKKRFYIVNLSTMQIEQAGLVSHGRGTGPSITDKQYSNEEQSRCTSLGRYIIGGKYKGSYGLAYRMTGLDSTNNKAYSRGIVLHSMSCIPDEEGFAPACVSDGCPSVSAKFLATLSRIIDTRKKPVLLWLFDTEITEAAPGVTLTDNQSSPYTVNTLN